MRLMIVLRHLVSVSVAQAFACPLALVLSLSSISCLAQAPAQPQTPLETPPVRPSLPFTTNANLFTSIEALDATQKLGPADRVSFRVIEDKDDAKPLMVTDSGELEIPYLGR